MRRRSFYGLTALALGATLTLAGCAGNTDDGASPAASSAASVNGKTPAAGGGTAATTALTADNFSVRLTAAQHAMKSVELDMMTVAAGQQISVHGSVDMGGSSIAMDEVVNMPGTLSEMRVRTADGLVYMNVGEASHGKWIEFDPSDASDPIASQFKGLLDGGDPTQQVEALKGAVTSLEPSGSFETIDGVKAQRYAVTVDSAKIGAALKNQIGAAAANLPKSVTYTYWIGDDDLVRKIESDVSGTQVRVTFSHWGEPVTIAAPPKSDILPGGIDSLTALES
ncbi:hypothetical protein GCM10025864_08410 [Luteimicrobium album]|uniref:LppX_LprAFG lipoprotein n=1 Tax=Luteimicrobium album TaxID=1054550 RepID=A0ABQ6HXF8_9MICO|nr:LppX_LprAFG lipoprotein [Luteimicrobium album]GMA23082.1 hypothetical protein GCM10025864_08410 [Luteimicrobium album]